MLNVSLEEVIDSLKALDRDLPYLEVMNTRLGAVRHHISTEGMSREMAEYLHGVDDQMLPRNLPTASFTFIPSKTNLTQSLEAIDLKRGAIIGAILVAIAAIVAKFFSWILGSDDSGSSGGGGGGGARVAELVTKIEDKTEKAEETIASIENKIEESSDPKQAREEIDKEITQLMRKDEYADITSEITDELLDDRSKLYVIMNVLMTKSLPSLYDIADEFATEIIAISKVVTKEDDFDEARLENMSKMQSSLIHAIEGSAEALNHFQMVGVDLKADDGRIFPEAIGATCRRVVEGIRKKHNSTNSKYERKFILEVFKSELAGEAMPKLIHDWQELTKRRERHLSTLANMDELVAKMPDAAKYGAGGGSKSKSYDIMRLITKGIIESISGFYSIMFELATLHLKHLSHINFLLKHIDAEYDANYGFKGEKK